MLHAAPVDKAVRKAYANMLPAAKLTLHIFATGTRLEALTSVLC